MEIGGDDQFIRDVEMLTEQYNNSRQSHGVTTPLQVEFSWYDILNYYIHNNVTMFIGGDPTPVLYDHVMRKLC